MNAVNNIYNLTKTIDRVSGTTIHVGKLVTGELCVLDTDKSIYSVQWAPKLSSVIYHTI